ncbi:amino acid permease [Sphingomonas sp. MMS24-JH45]
MGGNGREWSWANEQTTARAKVQAARRPRRCWASGVRCRAGRGESDRFGHLPAAGDLAAFGANATWGWVVTIAGAMTLAFVFARLAAAVPRAGRYAYADAAFGPVIGFATAWSYWTLIWAGNGAVAVAVVSALASRSRAGAACRDRGGGDRVADGAGQRPRGRGGGAGCRWRRWS